jgi:all-trans-retinol 13,14-reductase
MRDLDTIRSELRLLAAVRRSIREHGIESSSRHVDKLLDERLQGAACVDVAFLDRAGAEPPPRGFGFTHYSTFLIPEWVNALSDYARGAEILADAPGTRMPPVAVVDYSAIDSGLSPDAPHLVSVAGVDRVANWDGLDDQAYRAKRDGWLDAIVAGIDRSFPGFAGAVVQREMATAATMRHYLNTPDGAVYGFAPEPPKGLPTPLGRGVATTVPGLWLASAYGEGGRFTGTMLTGMLAAQAAMKLQHSHPSVMTTGT